MILFSYYIVIIIDTNYIFVFGIDIACVIVAIQIETERRNSMKDQMHNDEKNSITNDFKKTKPNYYEIHKQLLTIARINKGFTYGHKDFVLLPKTF